MWATFLLPATGWLSAPLMLTYSLAVALRFSFEMPAVWKANWLFAYLLDPQVPRAPAFARKLLWTLLSPLVLLVASAFCWNWGPHVGLSYAAYLLALTAMLVELLVVDFRKIPFTCNLPPFRNDTLAVMLGHLLGFALFTTGGAQLAGLMWRVPLKFGLLAMLVCLFWSTAWYWFRERAAGSAALQFTAPTDVAVLTLDLSDRA